MPKGICSCVPDCVVFMDNCSCSIDGLRLVVSRLGIVTCGSIPFRLDDDRMIGDFRFNIFESEGLMASSVLIESISGLGVDLVWAACSLFRLLCSFSLRCARICALNSVLSEYCFPHIVQVDGFS